ncbi:hypothetical protein [Buttiauxella agrestis]|uniref:Lysine-specific metallo-endopeptidase domain-containing protein n=1 Tax=Buttiauxella agrestis ATCC 33320 TaxID=1006004 RepID=A0A085GHY4_9ENTR|nr:hypothetical protein [Buttiauxella agrestis]KFC83329.1 hypothetical protein GBAG_0768 [Buttiauxella agrestis ATCC 33320]
MSNTTKGKPSKKTTIINQCKINDFNAMMKEAGEAMDRVLARRKKDLENWGNDEQEEFYAIFGSKGARLVHVNMPIKGVENIVEIKALDVMKDCIRRLCEIKKKLTTDSYINLIYDPDNPEAPTNSKIPRDPNLPDTFCAYVNPEQQDNYKVNIGINFTGRINAKNMRACGEVMGESSRVSTLCHEISHFKKKFVDSSLGGMGTVDYDVDGHRREPTEEDKWTLIEHQSGAMKLIDKGSENVFDNSYNIEKYFEIIV